MSRITRKDELTRAYKRFKTAARKSGLGSFEDSRNEWIPKGWCLADEYHSFRTAAIKGRTYIMRPDASCQGRGITLIDNPEDAKGIDECVVQEYLDEPLLLNGYKFDLRVYVLITSVNPLRIFVNKEGLIRLASVKYSMPSQSNMSVQCMHLTNYAVNKKYYWRYQKTIQISVGSSGQSRS